MSLARKLLHTRYRINDLERSVTFYRDILGLQEVKRHKSPRPNPVHEPCDDRQRDDERADGKKDGPRAASLRTLGGKDSEGNVLRGDVIAEDTRDSFVFSESRLVATVGLDSHVVVETKDAMMVAHKDKVQDVKKLVNKLDAMKRPEISII